jgi:hypothetical protein
MGQAFKEEHPALQQLVREYVLLREHNRGFKENDSQHNLFLFAEAALVCLALEYFARAVLGPKAKSSHTLKQLLTRAVSLKLVELPGDQQRAIKEIGDVRDTLLHADYAKAAREAKCPTVAEYFRTQFASEVERLGRIVDALMQQVDLDTGAPHTKR